MECNEQSQHCLSANQFLTSDLSSALDGDFLVQDADSFSDPGGENVPFNGCPLNSVIAGDGFELYRRRCTKRIIRSNHKRNKEDLSEPDTASEVIASGGDPKEKIPDDNEPDFEENVYQHLKSANSYSRYLAEQDYENNNESAPMIDDATLNNGECYDGKEQLIDDCNCSAATVETQTDRLCAVRRRRLSVPSLPASDNNNIGNIDNRSSREVSAKEENQVSKQNKADDEEDEEEEDDGSEESKEREVCDSYKILLPYNEAPSYLRFNQFIQQGYRSNLPLHICVESLFWLTNESVNIWSHVFGWLLFLFLMFYDLCLLNIHASLADKFLVGGLLLCFQFCMISSAFYHTFNCHSEHHYQCFLKYDLFGIACSLLAIYLSGIYYAFWCNVRWCTFYIGAILLIFILVLFIQIFHHNERFKIISFVSWAAFGVIPTIHWTLTMGGWANPIVQKLLPRVINMYIISGSAFGVYASYVPERFFPGRFDFFGSSHQIWHIFVVAALYYWHNTGINYIEYRMTHSCMSELNHANGLI